MIKIGTTTVNMPSGISEVYVGDELVWPIKDHDLIIITRNDYAVGWTNTDTDEVEVGYRRKALPEGYIETVYNIVPGGTLGDTGGKTNDTSVIEARILKEGAPDSAFYLWRTATGSAAGNGRVYMTLAVGAGNCRFGSENIAVSAPPLRDNIVTVRQDITGVYVDNKALATYSNPTVATSTETLKWGSSGTGDTASVKYYYFFHIRDGIIRTFYIPCIRKSDNIAGFYNLASDVFIEMGTAGPIK